MGDPWKSITPKGVQAFVNASIATLLVWLTVENHLSMVANLLVDLLSSKTFGLIVYYAIAVIILYKLLYKRSSYDVNEKRATKFAIISMILIWLVWEGYLTFLAIPLGMIGIFPALANSIKEGTSQYATVTATLDKVSELPVTVYLDGSGVDATDYLFSLNNDTTGTRASLAAHYKFNGDANDETDNNHDGTVSGATLVEDRFGNANSAYEFSGGPDYIFFVPLKIPIIFLSISI